MNESASTSWLEVVSSPAPALVQDAGRPGFMDQGVPMGGALVPELLALANRSLGNVWNAAVLELVGALNVVARGAVELSLDGELRSLADGETFATKRPEHFRASYLAVRGGFDVPVQLGGRGTLPVAGLGGWFGRALRRGDRLPIGRETDRARSTPSFDPTGPIRVVLGPDLKRFPSEAVERLLKRPFTISPSSDRVGTRLLGEPLARLGDDSGNSTPMVCGALQVPASGEPIALGPDHPTTGGYPVIAVIIRADRGRLFARRPGSEVHFQQVDVEQARQIWREHRAKFFG
jgi:biotin-dependent carboxylase-like uncharacterized protein